MHFRISLKVIGMLQFTALHFYTEIPTNCDRAQIIWHLPMEKNTSIQLSLRMLDNCLVVIQGELQQEIVYQHWEWGQPCHNKTIGIPSFGIRADSYLELRNTTGFAYLLNFWFSFIHVHYFKQSIISFLSCLLSIWQAKSSAVFPKRFLIAIFAPLSTKYRVISSSPYWEAHIKADRPSLFWWSRQAPDSTRNLTALSCSFDVAWIKVYW